MDIEAIVTNLARRDTSRSEATIQSDVRNLLLEGPFDLVEGNLEEVVLESPVGDRRRIDIELGRAVIETKKDLRRGKVLTDAQEQLAGYVEARQQETGFRYVGLLTDGVEWYCYHLQNKTLNCVSSFSVASPKNDAEKLSLWLDGVLATAKSISPVPREVKRRLGHGSSAHSLDRASLMSLYQENKNNPSIQIKRELWARLLYSALGTQFEDDDDLFIEHTLLVNSAEIIAHAVLGLPVEEISPRDLLTGSKFDDSGIYGVVESDFFDWVIELDEGVHLVRTLAQRLGRFEWSKVEHDILKILYESIILPETRKKLGEYYTPDWLAEAVVNETIQEPLDKRILDPSCGSGTFIFYAIKKYLKASEEKHIPISEAIDKVTTMVLGIDLHPVAVALARVTYLLAIGRERITDPNRGIIQVPIYLGDSIQMKQQENDLWSSGHLIIQVDKGKEYYNSQLRFPDSLLADASVFDDLVKEMATQSVQRQQGATVPSLVGTYQRLNIPADTHATLNDTFELMCNLHDQGRNHIWGYFIRNLARPMWLSRIENRVDILIGNPPWLAYRNMTEEMQENFKTMSKVRHLWEGAKVATQQDLSSFFVARATQLYLQKRGKFAFIMPNAVLDRLQYKGFRTGFFPDGIESNTLQFKTPWDLRRLRPHFFPRGSAVIFGHRVDSPTPWPTKVKKWSGKILHPESPWEIVEANVSVSEGFVEPLEFDDSPYKKKFTNGATIVPRVLFMVNRKEAGPLGVPHGKTMVQAATSSTEKKPWKDLPRPEGVIETQFVYPIYLGENILPYRARAPREGVIPLLDGEIIPNQDDALSLYPGLKKWWDHASHLWVTNRSSDRLTLTDQMNYRSKLTIQAPLNQTRVVYTKSGMHLAAARVRPGVIIDHSLYWCSSTCEEEAFYLLAIFNSPKITALVRPLMSYGKDERHFDKHLWKLPIPLFDASNELHQKLAQLGGNMEGKISNLEIDEQKHFPIIRRDIRKLIAADPDGIMIEEIVEELVG